MKEKLLPTYFISHGGGPWPWLKKEMPFYDHLEKSLKSISSELKELPKAILMISAHWETEDFSVMANPKPPMLYDYGGFPEHTYHIQYPAPGSPELAMKVKEILESKGHACRLDSSRGYDHGAFSPLAVMYPEANVPVVQLSINKNYDPETHYQLGMALAKLRSEQILIVGSGLSYHNLSNFGRSESAQIASKKFDDWLTNTLMLPTEERHIEILKWAQAPSAREAHPHEDHFIPVLVALGAAHAERAEVIYHEDNFFGKLSVSSFRFGSV